MKITIYTITECQFSKQEKEYLSSHGLQFEEKNLETNREFLTEMLAVGGNFAGTPVTKIEKDDGQIVVLKGFTAAEFNKVLAVAPPATTPVEPKATEQPEPPIPAAPPQPEAAPATTTDPAMASVLNTLVEQAQVTAPAVPGEQTPTPLPLTPPTGAPVIPNPQF